MRERHRPGPLPLRTGQEASILAGVVHKTLIESIYTGIDKNKFYFNFLNVKLKKNKQFSNIYHRPGNGHNAQRGGGKAEQKPEVSKVEAG